jgi:hypothetical protein
LSVLNRTSMSKVNLAYANKKKWFVFFPNP